MVLGIVGLLAWLLPIIGLPITIVGLVLGVKGRRSDLRGMATAGFVLSIIGLTFTVINATVGAVLGFFGILF